ncbi:MAG: hypothetical protein LBR13_01410 [Dysgonamonadaceae bacterium]|jgi:hypothetical protein|nr:hypothetical protein [Dysgonamonadaceae bacterium]
MEVETNATIPTQKIKYITRFPPHIVDFEDAASSLNLRFLKNLFAERSITKGKGTSIPNNIMMSVET